MNERPTMSVLLTTRNRARVLESALQSLASQEFAGNWEVVVVDGGSVDDTATVLDRMRKRLPMVALVEPGANRSESLNRALEAASGDLLVFAHDDARFPLSWLCELSRASREYPAANVLCGPVIPEFPEYTAVWLPDTVFSSLAFGRYAPSLEEGPLPASLLPSGCNFALRAQALGNMRFRQDLGPSGNDNLMCEDLAFLRLLRNQGEEVAFIPSAGVTHRVRAELIDLPAQFERAFNFGRSAIVMERILMVPPLRGADTIDPSLSYFEFGVVLNLCYGQLCQLDEYQDTEHCRLLSSMICALGWSGDPGEASPSMADWLKARPEYVPPSALRGPDALCVSHPPPSRRTERCQRDVAC